MPAALTKADLTAVTLKEYGKLTTQLDQLPEVLRMQPDDSGVSPKDIVGHRAHWIGLFLGWYEDGKAGKPVHFPADGYKWNDLVRYNADLRTAQASLGWDEARDSLEKEHGRLMLWIAGHTGEELYGGPMKGANNAWTPGRWAEAAGASHYRSATKYLRARIKNAVS
jgi:hypothetical protein